MDLPVSIAIIAAFVASTFATWSNSGNIYFDSVAMFVPFLSTTRFLEMRARHRSTDHATALAQLLPDTAIRIIDGAAARVALDRLRVNDTISILPGDVIPIDGEVLTGLPAFEAAYEAVGFGWLFGLTKLPLVGRLLGAGYAAFARVRTNLTRGRALADLLAEHEAEGGG